jgi:purine-binding chemotaxis protein CheW
MQRTGMANTNSVEPSTAASGRATPRQVLTFSLGREVYGVDILRVKEIRGWSPVTRIPQSPPAVLGVLNLRGAVVPIIDMRVRFALPAAEFTPITVIIVLSLHTESGVRECGIVVDSVKDVVDIAPDAVRPAPAINGNQASEFIDGVTTVDDLMLILLNADELIGRELAPQKLNPLAA